MAETDTESSRSLKDVIDEVIARRLRGEDWSDQDVARAHPRLMPQLEAELRKVRRVEQARRAANLRGEDGPQTGQQLDPQFGLPFAPTVAIDGYSILRLINHGGQAMIYLARRHDTGRHVALKILRFGALADQTQRARFEREAELLASIDHPNIVSVVDRGVTRDGQLYLAMNYIAGEPLNPEKLAARTSLCERLHLFVRICRAVHEAHRRGIIHRDLKPANVRLDETGQPHVLDFGLATDAGGGGARLRESMTVTGQFLGSFLWASPEQAEGAGELTAASDVYALGVMLHQLATGGRFPPQVFESVKRALDPARSGEDTRGGGSGDERDGGGGGGARRRGAASSGWSRRRSASRISRLAMSADIHPALAIIIERSLAHDPAARYSAAGELADAVEAFLLDPPKPQLRPRRPFVALQPIAHPLVARALAAAACVAVLAFGAWMVRSFTRVPAAVARVNGRPVMHLHPSLSFNWIPPGEFWMGSPPSESPRLPDERRHRVRIERGFYMMATEVPQWLYQQVMGTNPSSERGYDGCLPVESVSWRDAVAFCDAYSRQTGRRIRLPTEAEWEYACRAGTDTPWSFGDDPDLMPRYANTADRSSPTLPHRSRQFEDGFARTAPTQTFLSNAWGLVQMHGNVWEWCLTPYEPYPVGDELTIDRVPTMFPLGQFAAVARGGSWWDEPGSIRSANRCAIPSTTRENTLGFRIVCEDE